MPAIPLGLLEPDTRQRVRPGLRGPRCSNGPGLPGEVVSQRGNGGNEYRPKGTPERVDVRDFPDPDVSARTY